MKKSIINSLFIIIVYGKKVSALTAFICKQYSIKILTFLIKYTNNIILKTDN